MKGIILAGGTGSRLFPSTYGTSKQLLPVYDKPMIYYPLSLLMLAGIREILVITSQEHADAIKRTLGTGLQWGVEITHLVQTKPRGLPEAYLIAGGWLEGQSSVLILGDNIFHGHGMPEKLGQYCNRDFPGDGATIFTKPMPRSDRYGVLRFDDDDCAHIVEKPKDSRHEPVVTGLYVMDGRAPKLAQQLEPSARGELEIADLLNAYAEGHLFEEKLGRGIAWFDAGNPSELLEASQYVRSIQQRQGAQIACPEEIALEQGRISREQARAAVENNPSEYGDYVRRLVT